MPRFGLTVTFRLKPGCAADFLPLTRANAAASLRDEPGCLRFDVLVPEGGDGVEVFLYEVYADAEAFDLHLSAPHFRAFDAATRDMVARKEVRRDALEPPA
jgi:autoinducer 2-degrading protein